MSAKIDVNDQEKLDKAVNAIVSGEMTLDDVVNNLDSLEKKKKDEETLNKGPEIKNNNLKDEKVVQPEDPKGKKEQPPGVKLKADTIKGVVLVFGLLTLFVFIFGITKDRSIKIAQQEEEASLASPNTNMDLRINESDRKKLTVSKSDEEVLTNPQTGKSLYDIKKEQQMNQVGDAQRSSVVPAVKTVEQPILAQSMANQSTLAQQPGNASSSVGGGSQKDTRQEQIEQGHRSSFTPSGFTRTTKESMQQTQNQQLNSYEQMPEIQQASSPYTIYQGTIVKLILVTAICSDLPGQIVARVASDVYNSVSGQFLIIPAGSYVVGDYNSGVIWGESRILVAWKRLIRPDGSCIDLGSMNGVDLSGQSGYRKKVDMHFKELSLLLGVSTLMNIASGQISYAADKYSKDESGVGGLVKGLDASSKDATSAINAVAEKYLSVKPTLTIPAGTPCGLSFNKDIIISPYI